MARFLTGDPICQPLVEGRNGLHERWRFVDAVGFLAPNGKEYWTEPNFVGDGASIPPPLRVILGHPFRSDYIRPAVLHDYYYKTWAKIYGLTDSDKAESARLEIDIMLYRALLADDVNKITAYTIFLGVRVGGWHAWNNHAKEG